jgi:Tfp pilus assembly protein PilF
MFRYQGRDVDPQAVGRELGVGAVLTGKVMQRGEELVITVELVDSDNGWRLWGQQYNRKLSEIVTVEEEIAEEISTKLKLKLTGEERKRLARRHTANSEAYQLYLKGRYYWNKRTGEALQKGIEYFEQALEKDPNYALAYAGLADSYAIIGFYSSIPPRHVMPKAKVAATRALELDPQLAEAHSALAFLRFYYDWNWLAAETEFQRAFALNPNYANGHFWYSNYLSAQGRLREAQAEMQRALELDPLSLIINTGLGWIAYFARQHDRAIEIYRRTLELDPHFIMARYRRGQAYEQKGMLTEAIAEFQDTRAGLLLAHAYALAGRGDEARQLLTEITNVTKRRYLNSYDIAAIHVALGEPDAAFEHLERAYEEKSGWLIYLKVDPRLDSLHADPRYAGLLQRIGLPLE